METPGWVTSLTNKMTTLTEIDLIFLRRAIDVSRRAREHGNHPFGAVLVNQAGGVLLEVENCVNSEHDCTGHAEMSLIRQASKRYDRPTLAGCTLYSSTEPCAMCSGAIHWGNVGRVVYAMSEERLLTMTGQHADNDTMALPCREVFARCHPLVNVLGPALQDEAQAVHAGFWN